MHCVVCGELAVVWCHNDEAALCEGCDATVHATGPLAWKHNRVPICANGSFLDDCSGSDKKQPVHLPTNEPSPKPSHTVPDLSPADGGLATKRRESAFSIDLSLMLNEVDPCAGDSFDINQIAESFKGESLDLLNLPMMPSFDVMTQNLELPDVSHSPAPLQPAMNTVAPAQAAPQRNSPPAEMPPPADKFPTHSMRNMSSSTSSASTQSGLLLRKDSPQSQPPLQALPTPKPQRQQSQPPQLQQPAEPAPATAPAALPMVAAPPQMYMLPSVVASPFHSLLACMNYIPASLAPRTPIAREAAREALRARRERFQQKKRRMHGGSRVVRYISRKVYADTRPRVNGRFIRKDSMQQMAC